MRGSLFAVCSKTRRCTLLPLTLAGEACGMRPISKQPHLDREGAFRREAKLVRDVSNTHFPFVNTTNHACIGQFVLFVL